MGDFMASITTKQNACDSRKLFTVTAADLVT